MLHVDDLRLPLPPGVLDHPRLDHVEHVGVAIVVVSDVVLIQPRQVSFRVPAFFIPVGHHLMTVRIDRRPQHQDDVVEDGGDLRIGSPREQIVGELQRVLRSGDFGRVQAAVDVDDRLAIPGQGQRPCLAQALRPRQLAGDLAIAIFFRFEGDEISAK